MDGGEDMNEMASANVCAEEMDSEKVACYSLPAPPEEEKRRLAFLVSGSQWAETTSRSGFTKYHKEKSSLQT